MSSHTSFNKVDLDSLTKNRGVFTREAVAPEESIRIRSRADGVEPYNIINAARAANLHLPFIEDNQVYGEAGDEFESIVIYIHAYRTVKPFSIVDRRAISVCAYQAEGISAYAGMLPADYLLLLGLLGLTQLRAIRESSVIRYEDMLHPVGLTCLYSELDVMGEQALLLEEPTICPGCREFYSMLGARSELQAVDTLLAACFPKR